MIGLRSAEKWMASHDLSASTFIPRIVYVYLYAQQHLDLKLMNPGKD